MCLDRFENIYLEEYAPEFHFDFKVYGLEHDFIDHVMKTFENTTSNLGILLNGTKGTGKTVTAKILANKMNLPVIIVPDNYIYFNSTSTNTSVEFMQEGENFYYGSISKPLDENGFMELQDNDGSIYYVKVLNVDKKPSLYRGLLI